jgi:hypothetical protein
VDAIFTEFPDKSKETIDFIAANTVVVDGKKISLNNCNGLCV